MLDTLVTDFTDARLWLFVLIISAIGLVEKLAIYRAGKRSADADLSGLLGFTEERRARLETLFETKGSFVLLLASIPGIGVL